MICKWLDHFGLASSTSTVVLHTDAERAVSELVGTSSDKYTFLVRRARPQQHQSNGGAERAVRRLKESLAVLRAEMNQGGADVCFTERGLQDVATYIALSHNHFSKAHGTDFSPLEYSTQRKLSRLPLQCLVRLSSLNCPAACEPNHRMRPEVLKLRLCIHVWILDQLCKVLSELMVN